ncbi:MAG: FHA domain-containing protein [Deltaproteobacteria bacterium]|nr:FHA domain-containing protein [Deltaproteobacteria bacterium]
MVEDSGNRFQDEPAAEGAAVAPETPGEVAAAPAAASGFDSPPVTAEMPPLDETRATEVQSKQRRGKRRRQRIRRSAHVVVRRADGPPVKIAMERPQLSFGRDPAECDIVLEGTNVSRRHAVIDRDDEGYFTLRDCKSRNGTFVDGIAVETMNLVDGDVFEIGEHRIEFHAE